MTEHLLQGGEVFEITDYTTATEWERFIASLEEVFTDWGLNNQSSDGKKFHQLPQGAISSGIWREKHELIRFGRWTFDLRYQYLDKSAITPQASLGENLVEGSSSSDDSEFNNSIIIDEVVGRPPDPANHQSEDFSAEPPSNSILVESEREHDEHELPESLPECLRDISASSNDFASKAHCLVRWYNLRRFIIISPRGDTIISDDRVKLILSSASVALANVNSHIPVFVQLRNPKNNFFQGISEHNNIRAMYEMVFLRRSLKQYSYLSELIGLFREKAGCNLNDPISASIRLNYCLDNFDLFVSAKDEFDGNEHEDGVEDTGHIGRKTQAKQQSQIIAARFTQDMRTSASFEQVVEALSDCVPHPYKILKFLHVAALWPPISDKVITDSQVHSDLDPVEAPIWTIRCVSGDSCNMKIVHETQSLKGLFDAAIDYAYDHLNGDVVFGTDCDRDTLKSECLELSYKLATQPEVILSENPSDKKRKLIALLFHRQAELKSNEDALDEIAGQLRRPQSINEIYRNFVRRNKPSVKEFIIRSQVSRPFNPITSPALPQRMFCTIHESEFRLCGAFSELCN